MNLAKLQILFVVLLASITAFAQEPVRRVVCTIQVTGTEADYKRWAERDAAYLISRSEKKTLLSLKTNEEREKFVQDFWLMRDPTPGTEENEYQTEYYERIAYANEHFGGDIPGWKTDRGRVYIRWGAPEKRETGVTLDIDGKSVPYEKWHYGDSPWDLTPNAFLQKSREVLFVDPTHSDEFRISVSENRKRYPHI